MKKRTKKYNPRAKNIKRILFTLKNKCFVHTSLDPSVTCFHNHHATVFLPDNAIVSTLAVERFKWSTFIAVFFKDRDGKVNMKAESLYIDHPLKQNEVAAHLSQAHAKLIQSVNPKYFYGYGWLSSPFECDWSEEQAFKIFEHTGITNPDQFKENNDGSSRTTQVA